jgi:glutaminyl-peptide cyclotransferase
LEAITYLKERLPVFGLNLNVKVHFFQDMLILLDLLGTSGITLISYSDETSYWHNTLVKIEQQLKASGHWRRSGLGTGYSQKSTIFQARSQYGGIADDHIPFLKRGVDILHLIANPFPKEWHTPFDNEDSLDFITIDNLNKVFRIFVAKYLHLT